MRLEIDHLIISVRDLEHGARALEEKLGLSSVPGGRHTGHGTANRIVPLGPCYIELVTVVDESEAAVSSFGRWVAKNIMEAPRVDALCLRTDDIDGVSDRLDLGPPVPMSRERPDGTELAWRLAGLGRALEESLPFFIQWLASPEQLPGRAPIDHRAKPHGIAEVVLSGDTHRLRRWVGDTQGVRVVEGDPGVVSATIDTEAGPLRLALEYISI